MHDFDPEALKRRKICFSNPSAEEIRRIVETLESLNRVAVRRCEDGSCVEVAYDLREHTCEELEAALAREGFQLDSRFPNAVRRHLVHYTEEIERDNLNAPTRENRYLQIEANVNGRYHQQIEREHPLPPEDLRGYF
jgi:DNA-binding GntR family transcriptional regulator